MPATPPRHQSKNRVVLLEPQLLVLVRSCCFSFHSHTQKSNPLDSNRVNFSFAHSNALHLLLRFSAIPDLFPRPTPPSTASPHVRPAESRRRQVRFAQRSNVRPANFLLRSR